MVELLDKHFFTKVKIKEHDFIKEWFLEEYDDYIKGLPRKPSLTDYHSTLPNHKTFAKRPWEKQWLDYVRPYIKDFCRKFGVEDYHYQCWFAQYKELGQQHHWHIHSGSHFASVYFMDLPNKSRSTEFWQKKFECEEGEMVFFPSFWLHRSPPLDNVDKPKSVIAGNITFNAVIGDGRSEVMPNYEFV